MSGVFGCWHLDGRPVSVAALENCLGSISPGGLGNIDTWVAGSIGLGRKCPGHLDAARQPIGDTRVACIFDGRVDNRDELLDALASRWALEPDCADHRLIAAAYRQYGDACVERIKGDFAFGLFDRDLNRLLLA